MSYDSIIFIVVAIMMVCVLISTISLFVGGKRLYALSLLGACALGFLFLIFIEVHQPSFVTKPSLKNAKITVNGCIGQRKCHIVVLDSISYSVETSGDTLILKKSNL